MPVQERQPVDPCFPEKLSIRHDHWGREGRGKEGRSSAAEHLQKVPRSMLGGQLILQRCCLCPGPQVVRLSLQRLPIVSWGRPHSSVWGRAQALQGWGVGANLEVCLGTAAAVQLHISP